MTAFNPGDPVHVSFDGVVVAAGLDSVHVSGPQLVAWVAPKHLSPVPTPVPFADINVGDRIRAVKGDTVIEDAVEARTASSVGTTCYTFWDDRDWQFFRLTPPVPPEPEYEVGAIYQDAAARFALRLGPNSWRLFNGAMVDDDYPTRPLVRLVPEEQK